MSIVQLFSSQACISSSLPAIVDSEKELTFKELAQAVEKVAGAIQSHSKFKQKMIIPVCTDRSADLVIAILAILKAGGTFLAIPVKDLPEERLRYMLVDSRSNLIITDNNSFNMIEKVADQSFDLINVDMLESSYNFSAPVINLTDPAYVIYTSGTTGNPKGVVISHGAILNLITSLENCLYDLFSEPIREALTAPIMFDASVQQILSSVTNGNTLFIPKEEVRSDPFKLVKFMQQFQIQLINVVSSYLNAIIVSGIAEQFPASLKQIVTGGDAVTVIMIKNFYNHKQLQDVRITNMYGPTENCVNSTFYHISSNTNIGESIPIGQPIPGTNVSIHDEHGNEIDTGIGEILVSGKGLATEYLHLPKQTQEKFYIDENGKRFYKTGDLGYWNEHKQLEFSGRIDDQLKINGHRIEPLEIQETLVSLSWVKKASVFAYNITEERKVLLAFILVSRKNSSSKIRDFITSKLPSYMIPDHIIEVDDIPLTLNGKVDKTKLITLYKCCKTDNKPNLYCADDDLSVTISSVWMDVLGLSSINRTHSFQEIGGDSLQAIRVLGTLNRLYGLHLYVSDLLECENIDHFVRKIRGGKGENKKEEIVPSKKILYKQSLAQRRLYHTYKNSNLKLAYNVIVMFRYPEIDNDILQKTLSFIIQRHSILRTILFVDDSGEYQRIIPVENTDFALIAVEDKGKTVEEVLHSERNYEFNLEHPPLLRATVIRKHDSCSLVINVPHIAIDGWSLSNIYKEINSVYESLRKNEIPQLTPLKYSYIDYTIWHYGLNFSEHARFWNNYLINYSGAFQLPQDDYRSIKDFEADTYSTRTSREIFYNIQELSRSFKTTPATVLLAAFKLLLIKLTGRNDIVIGMGTLGRTIPEWDSIVGFFMNLLPVRTIVDPDQAISDLINNVKQSVNNVLHFQDYPLEKIAGILQESEMRDLFNVIFAYQNFNEVCLSNEPEHLPLCSINSMERPPVKFTKCNLSLYIYEEEEGYQFDFEYKKNNFKITTIQRWMKAYISSIQLLYCEIKHKAQRYEKYK